MADSAYTALTQRVTDLQAKLKTAQDQLVALRSDANIADLRSRLARLIAGGYGANTWIASTGKPYDGQNAADNRRGAESQVRLNDQQIIEKEALVADLTQKLTAAQKAVTDYQNTSPTYKAQVASDIAQAAGVSGRKTILVIAAFVLVVGIVAAIVITVKKQKTKTT